ncbi:MAG: GWxTD domain-containing protein [Acidobacteriota bacterium]
MADMIKKRLFFLIFAFYLLLPDARPSAADQQTASPPHQDKREPLSEASKQWLEEVVAYIITDAEKDVFLSLRTELERGKFIEGFWKKRDPRPDTPENEYKNEYYRRIGAANKLFGTAGIRGWRTDRGKVFILLGPPNEIQRDFSAAGSSLSGFHGTREVWNYWGLQNPRLPYNMEFVFIDKLQTGQYVLEKSVRLMDGGAAALDINSMRFEFDYLEDLAEALRNPFEGLDNLRGIITTQVSYEAIPVTVRLYSFKSAEKKTFLPLIVEVPYSAITPKEQEGRLELSLDLLVNISDRLGQVIFERSRDVRFKHTREEFKTLKEQMLQVQTSLSLEPADYRIHVLVLDNISGKVGSLHRDFSAPLYGGEGLTLSDIILSAEGQTEGLSGGMTEAEANHTFKTGGEMTVFFEIYGLALDPATGRNKFNVEYQFLQDGKKLAEVAPSSGESTVERDCRVKTTLRLRNFAAGEFVLRVKVTDSVSGKEAAKETRLKVT